MKNHELESKVLSIADRVAKGQTVEDAHVELKVELVNDHRKVARQIAGHANASFGQPILWIIGIDENNRSVPGATAKEFTSWWAQVEKCFSELSPEPRMHINIPYHDVTLAAILFETDRAPYVVKTNGKGVVDCEVPYRVATGVRSATRQQLLKILSPIATQPSLEVIECEFIYRERARSMNNSGRGYRFALTFLVEQPQDQRFFVIREKIKARVTSGTFSMPLKHFLLTSSADALDFVGSERVLIERKGPVDRFEALGQQVEMPLVVKLEFNSSKFAHSLNLEIPLQYEGMQQDQGTDYIWSYDSGEEWE